MKINWKFVIALIIINIIGKFYQDYADKKRSDCCNIFKISQFRDWGSLPFLF